MENRTDSLLDCVISNESDDLPPSWPEGHYRESVKSGFWPTCTTYLTRVKRKWTIACRRTWTPLLEWVYGHLSNTATIFTSTTLTATTTIIIDVVFVITYIIIINIVVTIVVIFVAVDIINIVVVVVLWIYQWLFSLQFKPFDFVSVEIKSKEWRENPMTMAMKDGRWR